MRWGCCLIADLVELRATLGTHATQLTSLDSDVQVLRQLVPVHGASLKATEAALQLLREGTERSIEVLRQEFAMDQKRRTHQEERAAEQHREAEVRGQQKPCSVQHFSSKYTQGKGIHV